MKYISLLRGINVSGKKKIIMKDLKALYESLGFRHVVTYIQSGNVIFESVVFEEREGVYLKTCQYDIFQIPIYKRC